MRQVIGSAGIQTYRTSVITFPTAIATTANILPASNYITTITQSIFTYILEISHEQTLPNFKNT
jgi:hypothetical protein